LTEVKNEDLTLYFLFDAALGGIKILHPNLLDMNQRALPLAEQEMRQRGKHEQVVFGVYGNQSLQPISLIDIFLYCP